MKKHLLTLMLLMVVALMSSCTKMAETYEFPLDKETVQKVVQDKNLTWNITDEQYSESQSSFVMKESGDETGRVDVGITAIINSISNKAERFMSVQLIYPNDFSSMQIQEEKLEDIPLLFDMAVELYGSGDSAKSIYNEFVKYLDGYKDYESNGMLWEQEVKDTHVLLRMSPLNKQTINRKLAVFIMNDVSYEKYKDGISLNN